MSLAGGAQVPFFGGEGARATGRGSLSSHVRGVGGELGVPCLGATGPRGFPQVLCREGDWGWEQEGSSGPIFRHV